MYDNTEGIQIETVERHDNIGIEVVIIGQATIENAIYIRDQLLKIVSKQKPILLDMTGIEVADTSFLQILFALKETSKIENIDFTLQYLEPEHPLMELAIKLGQNMYSFDHMYGIAFDIPEGDML